MPDLALYNKCNNNCIICSNSDEFKSIGEERFNLKVLLKSLADYKEGKKVFLNNYIDSFTLGGGEPTICNYTGLVIRQISSYFPGIRISCLSNGRKFYYIEFAKWFLALYDNLELIIPLHGCTSKMHDAVTCAPGSFKQTIAGLRNLFKLRNPKQLVEIRIVVHKINYLHLEGILNFIRKEFPFLDRLVVLFFEIEGQAIRNLRELKLTYSQLYPQINKLSGQLQYFKELRLYHFPLCALKPELYSSTWRTLPACELSFLKSCGKCLVKEFCMGIHKNYLKYVGTDEFLPIRDRMDICKGNNCHNPIKKCKVI